jgi:hypothetical protein
MSKPTITVLAFMLWPLIATSSQMPYMNKDNWKELGIRTYAGEACPVSTGEMDGIAADVLRDAEIRIVEWKSSTPFVMVIYQCRKDQRHQDYYHSTLRIEFAAKQKTRDGRLFGIVRFGTSPAKVALLSGDRLLHKSALKKHLQSVIGDYRETNLPSEDEETRR